MLHERDITEILSAAPVNAESFATFIEETDDHDIAMCSAESRERIAAVIRSVNPSTYGELLKTFHNREIHTLTQEVGMKRANLFLAMAWGFSHEVYGFLRNKNPWLPRNGYRPDEIDAMSQDERCKLDVELEESFELIEHAITNILGTDPGDL